jgi:hypothetical protein
MIFSERSPTSRWRRASVANSIIAVRGAGPIEEDEDGVVAYRSAHLDGVESELVIRSGHSLQDQPEAVEEVRRILLFHARDLP